MSCGQRSQVALGLILAQDPDLLILDDFSMGLDPGYRRLFIDYLREYAKAERKTIFTTSHIIQDMERLIDDLLIVDHKGVLTQTSVTQFLENFKRFDFELESSGGDMKKAPFIANLEQVNNKVELYTYAPENSVKEYLREHNIKVSNFSIVKMGLEDAFIGLTGKY
jgi:ABC-2 type transport system ATP-binding protein